FTLTLSGFLSDDAGGRLSITKIGSGRLILTEGRRYVYTGPTNVNAGILEVDGSLSSIVTVNNGGTLVGNGTLGGLNVASGGIVAPGNSIGTLNVSVPLTPPFAIFSPAAFGNVIFSAGSTYLVEINAAGQSDKILAAGKATLNGGTVQVTA